MHRDGELNSGKPSKIRFNIMAVGEIGSGKTAFLKTLFKAYCASDRVRNELYTKAVKTVKIEEFGCFVLVDTEYEVHIFDSPGYGDCMNNQYSIEALKNYLENAHKAWLETNCNQMTEEHNGTDKRIHCVFYFITPHRIKDSDKEFIKQLTGLAPVVLVGAKADTMTTEERKDHVLAVMDFIEKELSSTYKLPILDFFPVASNTFGRELPWGRLDICDVENSDFPRLQRLVFEGNCINKLRDMTQVMTLQRETERSLQEALHHSTVKVYLSKVLGAAQSAKWVVDEIVLTAFWVLLPVIVVVWLSAQM